jgi:hypothetical protein
MIWLRSVRLILPVLAFVACAAAVAVSDSRTEAPHASHPTGAHCPESRPEGAPSGTGCACACCPGKAPISLPQLPDIVLGALPVCRRPAPPHDELQPDDLVQSIFHPPRRLTPA